MHLFTFRFRISGQLVLANGPEVFASVMISVFMVLIDTYADEGNCNFAAGRDGRTPVLIVSLLTRRMAGFLKSGSM